MREFRWRTAPVLATSLAALAAASLQQVPVALAAHDAGESCYNCHTLDEVQGDPNTSLINKLSRTFPLIKKYDGLPPAQTPANLGCTYCHNDNGHADRMKPALADFQGRTSFHPVGFDFRGAGADTNNEYLSTLGSATDHELDCVDCHDVVACGDGRDDPETDAVDEGGDREPGTSRGGATDKYPEHGAPADPINNPFMLRSVSAAGEHDALCRICHRSDAAAVVKGVDLQLQAHADNAAGRPLRESDGTVLRTADLNGDGTADTSGLATTAQCTACHDTHYSTSRRLFNDGHEQHKTGAGLVPDAPITSGDCTGLCHYAGDWNNAADGGTYFKRGHGMALSTYKYKNGVPDASGTEVTMGYACTACHVGIDPAQKPHANDTAGATNRDRYVKRFNLSGTLQAKDPGSALGNPLFGICASCHQRYEAHRTAGGGAVGCQDCHDEHAEGSGVRANVMMIPEKAKPPGFYGAADPLFAAKAGTETITYDTPAWDTDSAPYEANADADLDFFRARDADGICDNVECHGNKSYAPLGAWISKGDTSHAGGQQAPGTDCSVCHRHNGDESGGWRAQSTCNECHAAEGRNHAGETKSATTHRAHATSRSVAGCASCHLHDGRTQLAGTGDHGSGGEVNFGGTSMTSAFDYAGAFETEDGCDTPDNGCHNNSGGPGRWNGGRLASCADCHAAAPKLLARAPTTGLHAVTALTRHDESLLEGKCTNCHDAARPSGAHRDGTLNSAATAELTFHANVLSYSPAAGCRAAESCHGGGDGGTWRRRWLGVVDALPGTPGNDAPGQAVCQDCHGDFGGWRWDEAEPTTSDHTDPYAGNAGERMGEHDGCRTCHGWGSAAYDMRWG
ncbi:MAG TPA: hypothetical protein VN317_04045, partial [Candidatus Methanoperedens sp.]|nr:hypothetical protein [Candidatus Methanoperedens sp.]